MSEHEEDTCGDHYRIEIQVDSCSGLHFAVGFNFHGTMQENIAGLRTLILASAKTTEQRAIAESTFNQLQAAFDNKPTKGNRKPGPKVVPIRPAPPEYGPFAKGCTYIDGPHLVPGWSCCACAAKHPEGMATYNGIIRDVCKMCGHKCCMPSKALKAARRGKKS